MSLKTPRSVKANIPLHTHTTLGVGGPARFLATCPSPLEVARCLEWAEDKHLEVFILGGGSNLVVADRGFDGLVIRPVFDQVEIVREQAATRVIVDAGVAWDHLVAQTIRLDLAGLECLSGIPGNAGACPVQNIGAYGQEVSTCIDWIDVLDRQSGETRRMPAADCGFGYRTSFFKTTWHGQYVILRVAFRLTPGGRPQIRYAELARRLEALRETRPPTLEGVANRVGDASSRQANPLFFQQAGKPAPHQSSPTAPPSLREVRETVLAIRASKSMLFDLEDPNGRSAGSFFTNPMVTQEVVDHVHAVAAEQLGPDGVVQGFPTDDGRVKLPAAWLIEAAGFPRGYRLGRAAISSKHALAIVNTGGATADEIVTLAIRIREAVLERFDIALAPEPHFLGFDAKTLGRLGLETPRS